MSIFLQKLTIFLLPFFLIIGVYISLDPFKVIYSYDSFYDESTKGIVTPNKDYVSTCTFDKNYISQKYNSFILGNSRSIFYQVIDWKKYLPNSASCFHFDASGESLFAIAKKIEYLDRKGVDMDNILLILDYSTLIQDHPKSNHLSIISPQLIIQIS